MQMLFAMAFKALMKSIHWNRNVLTRQIFITFIEIEVLSFSIYEQNWIQSNHWKEHRKEKREYACVRVRETVAFNLNFNSAQLQLLRKMATEWENRKTFAYRICHTLSSKIARRPTDKVKSDKRNKSNWTRFARVSVWFNTYT